MTDTETALKYDLDQDPKPKDVISGKLYKVRDIGFRP